MPAKKHHVTLSEEQQKKAQVVARSYKHSDRERKRAKILLLADANRAEGAEKDAVIEPKAGWKPLSIARSNPPAKPACWMEKPKPS
jgi:hypothetical protein